MADKAITDLTQATQITNDDLFVLQQGDTAKKLKGETLLDFVTLSVVKVTVTTLPAGSAATATYDKAAGTLALGIPQGDKGATGETGATGATGPQGEQGIQGETGATGATGPQGEQGIQGETGATGATGPQGKQGPQGEKGDTGAAGKDGISFRWRGAWDENVTYEPQDAVSRNGSSYICNMSNTGVDPASLGNPDADTGEWQLMAKMGATGARGPAGPQGEQGEKGDTGATGADGHTPVKGVDYFTPEEVAEITNGAAASAQAAADAAGAADNAATAAQTAHSAAEDAQDAAETAEAGAKSAKTAAEAARDAAGASAAAAAGSAATAQEKAEDAAREAAKLTNPCVGTLVAATEATLLGVSADDIGKFLGVGADLKIGWRAAT